MKTLKPIAFKRLRDTNVSGNFTIKCQFYEQFLDIQRFFGTSKDNVRFKDISEPTLPYFPLMISGDKRLRFIIKYENLNELLKLREIFNIRGGKFDMKLIEKRDYNPFDKNFFTKLTEPVKIIKK